MTNIIFLHRWIQRVQKDLLVEVVEMKDRLLLSPNSGSDGEMVRKRQTIYKRKEMTQLMSSLDTVKNG